MSYPDDDAPGYRKQANGETTSRDAAEAVKPKAKPQATLALDVIVELGKASPEEVTAALRDRGHTVLLNSIRARITGMHKRGRLRPSGSYGKGESGKCRTIRWELDPTYSEGAAQ